MGKVGAWGDVISNQLFFSALVYLSHSAYFYGVKFQASCNPDFELRIVPSPRLVFLPKLKSQSSLLLKNVSSENEITQGNMFHFQKKHSFPQMITSNWYEDLSFMIISFCTLKIILIKCFCFQKMLESKCVGIEINKTNKKITNHQNYTNIYFLFVSFFYIYSVWFISFFLT